MLYPQDISTVFENDTAGRTHSVLNPNRTNAQARVKQSHSSSIAREASSHTRHSKLVLAIVSLMIAVLALNSCALQNHTLENDLSKEQLQQIADGVRNAYGWLPCTVEVGVSGNTVLVRTELTVDIDKLAGAGIMQLYEGFGIDQLVSGVVFTKEAANEMKSICQTAEKGGYTNTKVVCELCDRTGARLVSKTFTSNG